MRCYLYTYHAYPMSPSWVFIRCDISYLGEISGCVHKKNYRIGMSLKCYVMICSLTPAQYPHIIVYDMYMATLITLHDVHIRTDILY